MRHRQHWGKETCITTTLLSTTPGMSLGNTLGTAQGAPAQVRGAEPSLGESSLVGLENLILEKMLLHCFQSGAGKVVPAPGCSGQSLAGWGCWGSQGCCPETGVPQQEPCCSLLLFPPRDALPPELSSGNWDGQKETRPARALRPARPHRHHQGSLAKDSRETHPGTPAQHWNTEREAERPFGGGSASRITSKAPRATSLQGHSSTAGPTASKSSLRERAPAPAPFPGNPWPRGAGRAARHRSPPPSRELSIPGCQPGPGASERGRGQV